MKKIFFLFPVLLTLFSIRLAASDKAAYLHFMNGMVLERKGSYDSALQEYKTTIVLDPRSVFVKKQAMNLALHLGKAAEAEEWAKYVVKVDSATADNWVLYGNVLWAKGAADAAREKYEKAMALDPENSEAVYQLASLWSSKSPDKSVEYLKKYLELKPEAAPDVYYQIAMLYNVKSEYDPMLKYLLMSKAADPDYARPRYMLANYYEVKNATAAAIAEYLDLLTLEKDNPEIFVHLGELYATPAVSNPEESEKYFIKAYAVDKTNPAVCFWLSVFAEQRKDFSGAAAYLETSKDLKDNAGTALRLGYYYTQSGGYDKAIKLLEEAHKKWPENQEVSYFLALGYDDTHREEKSLGLLNEVLAKNSEHAEARMQRAVIAERTGNMVLAEQDFRYLLAKDPNNPNLLNYLGYSLTDRGLKLSEAQELISKAVSLSPANGAYRDSLAWVYFKQGKIELAEMEIQNALKTISDDPTLWAHAAEIYAAGGDARRAWRAYSITSTFSPEKDRDALSRKIKTERAKIPASEATTLTVDLIKALALKGKEFSAFTKVTATFKGKQLKMDGVLQFSKPDKFSFTLLGPLMSPVWRLKAEGSEIEMDAPSLKEVDPLIFKYWAELAGTGLKDYFSGAYLNYAKLEEGWDSDYLTGPAVKVYYDGAAPERLVFIREKKMTISFGGYTLKNMCLVPKVIDIKLPFFSLKIELDTDRLNLNEVNLLVP